MLELILLIDFGSTYTKLTAIDIQKEEIVATAKAPTTVNTHIMDGLNDGLNFIYNKLNGTKYEIVEKLASSSAAGGLRMDAVGLVPELTVEAAKKAVLNAGAKLVGCYSYKLQKEEIERILKGKSDIILLVGGTDGGNIDVITYNAKMLADSKISSPVVLAGNKECKEEISRVFKNYNKDLIITKNVMPNVNELNIIPVREEIRKIFIDRIIKARGIKEAERYVDKILMPTPTAVLQAARLLADGIDEEPGIGDLIVVDIGGATTDVHSIANGNPSRSGMIPKGLLEPYEKRTVEGDIGVRYNAKSIIENVGLEKFSNQIGINSDSVVKWIETISGNKGILPTNNEEFLIDKYLAYHAVKISVARHAGFTETHYTPMGVVYALYGKDLSKVHNVIGTGGSLLNSTQPKEILNAASFDPNEPEILKPLEPKFYIDSSYILYAAGLISETRPLLSLRIMKKYIAQI